MNKLRIALLQISPTGSLEGNLLKGIKYCKKASLSNDIDIILFPEMWSNGYDIYERKPEEWIKDAISIDSDFVNTFKNLAKELNFAIGVTLLEKSDVNKFDKDSMPKNTMVLFDRHGNLVLKYSKVHTCDFSVEKYLTPGEDFYVCDLDTKVGTVKVGSMICYDREFPESARVLMLKGAELILVPNACPMEINRLSQLRGRAYENMVAIATCNYPIDVPDCNGHSSVFDGVAYHESVSGSRDTCLLEASEEEGVYITILDLDMLREYRNNEVHGNSYRRPDKYKILLEENVKEPFIRSDKRK